MITIMTKTWVMAVGKAENGGEISQHAMINFKGGAKVQASTCSTPSIMSCHTLTGKGGKIHIKLSQLGF